MEIVKNVAKFLTAVSTFLLVSVVPAFANIPDAGEETGEGLSALETILWFVVTPTVVWVIIWFLWSIPKWRKSNMPQTGENWNPKPSSDVANH
jgi:heme/copper-type cytochrome/quinol oxidase subunit 2